MMAEAKAQGLRVSGHVTQDVGSCMRSSRASRLSTSMATSPRCCLPETRRRWSRWSSATALAKMSPARIPTLAEATKKAGIFNSPTLALFEIVASDGAVPELRSARELRYVPSAAVDAWTKELLTGPLSQAPVSGKHRFLELRRQVLQGLHAAGAPLLVGSDSPQLFMVPGFALHQEMEAMTAAGLPPLTVLQAATRNAAASFGESDQWGSVAPGQRADLLLLNANPLQDVTLTRDPRGRHGPRPVAPPQRAGLKPRPGRHRRQGRPALTSPRPCDMCSMSGEAPTSWVRNFSSLFPMNVRR